MKRQRLLQLVAKAAATQLASLPAARRADVLEGLALILAGKKEKDLARYTAGLIRLADEHQAKFFQELNEEAASQGDVKTGRRAKL
ncbi:MAG TPA: hypothetical protein VG347_04605 [Verrucomicrobiae bacterium]|nr:hypothetical protein [Verrucomicrobiae bacterium]